MIRHEKIRTVIDDKETREFLKGLFEKNMSEGTDRTSILRFCETLTDILRDEVGIIKGKRQTSVVSDTWKDEIKNRFTRGKKWVKIMKDNELYQTAINLAVENGYDHLIELWENKGFAWVRFHSPTKDGANFSIHPNSSVGSNIKFSVDKETAQNFEIMTGTPKGLGYEMKTVKVQDENQTDEKDENQTDQTDENQTDETDEDDYEEVEG